MINEALLYIAAALPFFWGVAHLFPTNSVVKGFGDISPDNKRIITMEWIVEGVALIFVGVVIASVTYIDYTSVISKCIYTVSFIFLNIFSIVSLLTGFKINFIPFKLCPVIFTASSMIILIGNFI